MNHGSIIWCVQFSPCGNYLATSSNDYKINIWDTHSDSLLQVLDTHSSYVYKVRFTGDSNFLLSVSDDKSVGVHYRNKKIKENPFLLKRKIEEKVWIYAIAIKNKK
jgi:WD40 repeat protein